MMIALILAASTVPAALPLARCPAVLAAGTTLSPGARLLGKPPAGGLPLSFASLTNDAPADVDANDWVLAEFPADDSSEAAGIRVDRTAIDTTADTVTLACRYGPYPGNPRPTALLLIPVPTRSEGVCRFTIGPKRPAAMVCVRGK